MVKALLFLSFILGLLLLAAAADIDHHDHVQKQVDALTKLFTNKIEKLEMEVEKLQTEVHLVHKFKKENELFSNEIRKLKMENELFSGKIEKFGLEVHKLKRELGRYQSSPSRGEHDTMASTFSTAKPGFLKIDLRRWKN